MDNSVIGLAELTFDPVGGLSTITYPDGSMLFGDYLDDYDAYMAEKFGDRWQGEMYTLRLCHFDANNPLRDRHVVVEGEARLDPKEFGAVYSFGPDGIWTAVLYPDGSVIDGEALAEHFAMSKAKFGHLWEANKGKLMARRIDDPGSALRGLKEV